MIDIHYHHYWNIMLSIGIMVIFVNIITIIIYVIIGKNDDLPNFINEFWEYFDNISFKIFIFKFIINFVFQFISCVLEILTIFYLSPEYTLISQNLFKIYMIILILIQPEMHIDYNNQYCFLIFFIFQVFSLLIYLEIFELNFCNSNKNTRKNIKSRINDDLVERIDSLKDNQIETKGGYLFNNTEKDDIIIEL